jgi:hypothetical protein
VGDGFLHRKPSRRSARPLPLFGDLRLAFGNNMSLFEKAIDSSTHDQQKSRIQKRSDDQQARLNDHANGTTPAIGEIRRTVLVEAVATTVQDDS